MPLTNVSRFGPHIRNQENKDERYEQMGNVG